MVIDLEAIQSFIAAQGVLAPLVYMGLLTVAIVIAPMPGWPLVVASAALFGPFWGAVYAVPAVCLGATIAFGLARRYGRPLVLRLVPESRLVQFERQLSGRQETLILLVLRLMPFSPFDIINYAAGLTRISYRNFILVTIMGVVPHNFVLAYFGHYGLTGNILGILAICLLLLLAILLWPRLMRRFNKTGAS
jgi:uncharacterized membrane protein YdjX (TVP38/TMEM64 family)